MEKSIKEEKKHLGQSLDIKTNLVLRNEISQVRRDITIDQFNSLTPEEVFNYTSKLFHRYRDYSLEVFEVDR